MANETAGADRPPRAGSEAVLALQNVYLKDCSYESPNGPRMEGNWNPQINLDLQTGSTALGPEVREVVLTVTVSAKYGEATIFLVGGQAGGPVRDPQPLRGGHQARGRAPTARACCFRTRARRSRTWSRRAASRSSCCRR